MEDQIRLITFKDQKLMDSRDVAELIDKRHDHLVRDIDRYILDIDHSPKLGNGYRSTITSSDFFIPSQYETKSGRNYRNYLLTKKGCEFVANKMIGTKGNVFTATYVALFNQMENTLELQKPDSYMIDDPVKRAERWIEERKEYEKLLPKAKYYDECLNSPELIKISLISIDYGLSAVTFNRLLEALGIQYRQGNDWILKEPYKRNGWMKSKTKDIFNKALGKTKKVVEIKWTFKGRTGLYDFLAKYDINPTIEGGENNFRIAKKIIDGYRKLHQNKKVTY